MSEEFMKSFLIIILVIFLLILGIPMFMMLFMGWGTAPTTGGMMNGMMGMGVHMFNMFIPFWLFLFFFIIILAGLVYMVSQKSYREAETPAPKYYSQPTTESKLEPDIFKVLRPDEKMVVDLLIKNGGRMLQKDLRWELGMNRVQIHRIIERLEERNIVSKKPVGNTNEIVLADWIVENYVDRDSGKSETS